jgi:D-lactate dehydrogenase (quinone)
METTMIDRDATGGTHAPTNARLLDELRSIVGRRYVLITPQSTRRYRTGFRFGIGPALAVVRPGTLVEQWKVLKVCGRRIRSSSCRPPITVLPEARRRTVPIMIAKS